MLEALVASPAVQEAVDLKWYVLVTQPRQENRACFFLEKFGFEPYCPVVPKRRQRTRYSWLFGSHTTWLSVEEPYLSGYVFLQLNVPWAILYELPGLRFGDPFLKGAGGEPAVLSESEIKRIGLDAEEARKKKPLDLPFQIGDFVEILEGSYKGKRGYISRLDNRKRIIVSFLRSSLQAVVQARMIKAAPSEA